jgi:hypothetical protein
MVSTTDITKPITERIERIGAVQRRWRLHKRSRLQRSSSKEEEEKEAFGYERRLW